MDCTCLAALCVGIEVYQHGDIPDLPNASRDANNFSREMLRRGFQDNNLFLLEGHVSQQKLKEGFLKFLECTENNISSEGVQLVVVFIAAHGKQPESSELPAILASDSENGMDSVLDLDTLLLKPLDSIQGGRIKAWFVVDTCRENKCIQTWTGHAENSLKRLRWSSETDFQIVLACDRGRVASDQHSLTAALLCALRSQESDLEAVCKEAQTSIEERSEGRQRPWRYCRGDFSGIFLPAEERPCISPDEERPRISPDEERPCISPDEERPRISPDEERPRISPDEERPCISPDEERPCISPDEERPCISPDEERPRISPDEERPRISPDEERPCISPDEERPCISPDEERPCMHLPPVVQTRLLRGTGWLLAVIVVLLWFLLENRFTWSWSRRHKFGPATIEVILDTCVFGMSLSLDWLTLVEKKRSPLAQNKGLTTLWWLCKFSTTLSLLEGLPMLAEVARCVTLIGSNILHACFLSSSIVLVLRLVALHPEFRRCHFGFNLLSEAFFNTVLSMVFICEIVVMSSFEHEAKNEAKFYVLCLFLGWICSLIAWRISYTITLPASGDARQHENTKRKLTIASGQMFLVKTVWCSVRVPLLQLALKETVFAFVFERICALLAFALLHKFAKLYGRLNPQ